MHTIMAQEPVSLQVLFPKCQKEVARPEGIGVEVFDDPEETGESPHQRGRLLQRFKPRKSCRVVTEALELKGRIAIDQAQEMMKRVGLDVIPPASPESITSIFDPLGIGDGRVEIPVKIHDSFAFDQGIGGFCEMFENEIRNDQIEGFTSEREVVSRTQDMGDVGTPSQPLSPMDIAGVNPQVREIVVIESPAPRTEIEHPRPRKKLLEEFVKKKTRQLLPWVPVQRLHVFRSPGLWTAEADEIDGLIQILIV